MRHVGRLVTSEGIQVDPKDLEAVLQWKEREPKNVGEVRALLGFLGYYRSFIQDFSRIAWPLFKLQESRDESGENPVKTRTTKQSIKKKVSCRPRHQSSGPLNTVLWLIALLTC